MMDDMQHFLLMGFVVCMAAAVVTVVVALLYPALGGRGPKWWTVGAGAACFVLAAAAYVGAGGTIRSDPFICIGQACPAAAAAPAGASPVDLSFLVSK